MTGINLYVFNKTPQCKSTVSFNELNLYGTICWIQYGFKELFSPRIYEIYKNTYGKFQMSSHLLT